MPTTKAEEAKIALIVAELGCQMCEKKVLEIAYRRDGTGPVRVSGVFRVGSDTEIQFEILLRLRRVRTSKHRKPFRITKVLAVVYWGAMARTHIWCAESKRWVAT